MKKYPPALGQWVRALRSRICQTRGQFSVSSSEAAVIRQICDETEKPSPLSCCPPLSGIKSINAEGCLRNEDKRVFWVEWRDCVNDEKILLYAI